MKHLRAVCMLCLVSTHSPDFLNAVPIESIYWLEKSDGGTSIHHPSEYPLLMNLSREGDPPGVLWNQGWFDTRRLLQG